MKRPSLLWPIALGTLSALGAAGYFLYSTSRASTEIAGYTVIRSDGPVEIRDYPRMQTARTSMRSQNDAFMRLFRFIAGGNSREEKIPMTAPVLIDGGHSMSFVLPEKLAIGSAPTPTGEGVSLGEMPPMRVIVLRYSGAAKPESRDRELARLRAWAAEEGITTEGEPIDAFYDSPMTPGFLRRNEVFLRMAPSS